MHGGINYFAVSFGTTIGQYFITATPAQFDIPSTVCNSVESNMQGSDPKPDEARKSWLYIGHTLQKQIISTCGSELTL